MEKALARWFVRLPIAVCICVVSGLSSTFFPHYEVIGSESIMDYLNLDVIAVAMVLLLGQLFLNSARVGGGKMTCGLALTPFTIRHLLIGLGISVACMGVIYSIGLLGDGGIGHMRHIRTSVKPESILVFSVFITSAALLEELTFRGLLFESLSERLGEVKTAVVLSLLLAATHIHLHFFSVIEIINVALAGMLLSSMRIVTRTLWMPLAFHVGWNWMHGIGLELPFFERQFPNLTHIYLFKSALLLPGGSFIVDGEIVTTLLFIVAIPLVFRYAKSDLFVAVAETRRRFAENRLMSYKQNNI